MLRRLLVSFFVVLILFGCGKQTPVKPPEVASPPVNSSVEPIQRLAFDAAQQITNTLRGQGIDRIEFSRVDGHDIFPAAAVTYFENAIAAQLGAAGIQRGPDEWRLSGDLSKQHGEILFSFKIFKGDDRIFSGLAQIPDDENLQKTLAQFEQAPAVDEHAGHKEMPVPTPLVELKQVPLDTSEHCSNPTGDCTLLLLYRDQLVERNWKQGTDRVIPFRSTGIRSRAPSGKILKLQNLIFILTNELTAPLVYDRNLERAGGNFPSHLPKPEPGLNSYSLADGRFFDFDPFGEKGLAVVDLQNRLSVAGQRKLLSADQPAGSTLSVSPPFIYTSSPVLPVEERDILLKFSVKDELLQMEKSQTIDGSVYDIAITDLNRDGQKEMLLTVRNSRGTFIEVHEPF